MTHIFDHIFIDNYAKKTLVTLHGTGGSKKDFVFLNAPLESKYNILGLQGNIDEQGYSRFFKRLSEGVFDQESIKAESQKLTDFLNAWMTDHKLTSNDLIFIGNSNGANMILATLFLHPEVITTAVLMHAMLPFEFDGSTVDFSDKNIIITLGEQDHLVSKQQQQQLVRTVEQTNVRLDVKKYPGGHSVSQQEIRDIVTFLRY